MGVRFSIITPTLLRPSLLRTCTSVDKQTYKGYEHLVMIDLPDNKITPVEQQLLNKVCKNPNRKIVHLNKRYGAFGNTPRNIAGKQAIGEYLMYLDDDDFYINDTLAQLNIQLAKYGTNTPDMAVFRCLRNGTEFTTFPPALCHTVSCQWMHKKYINGKEVLWATNDSGYFSDGNFLESVKKLTKPVLLRTPAQLVCVDVYSGGKK